MGNSALLTPPPRCPTLRDASEGLRPAAFIAGSLVDFLKTSEGVKLSINKLLDMAAQVSGDGAMGLLGWGERGLLG